jgi:hypothetical protein
MYTFFFYEVDFLKFDFYIIVTVWLGHGIYVGQGIYVHQLCCYFIIFVRKCDTKRFFKYFVYFKLISIHDMCIFRIKLIC